MDGYLNNPGFPISANDQIAYNKLIAKLAHNRGKKILRNFFLHLEKIQKN